LHWKKKKGRGRAEKFSHAVEGEIKLNTIFMNRTYYFTYHRGALDGEKASVSWGPE